MNQFMHAIPLNARAHTHTETHTHTRTYGHEKKKSKKTGGIRTDTFELADITKDPAVGPDGAPNPKTSNPIRRKTTKEKKDEAKKRGLPSTEGDSQSDKPTPRNIFSFLPGQVDIPIITK